MSKKYELNKKIALIRHTKTIYNKNLDLMYDEDGVPTKLRKKVNTTIAMINNGKIPESSLNRINCEILWERLLKMREELRK